MGIMFALSDRAGLVRIRPLFGRLRWVAHERDSESSASTSRGCFVPDFRVDTELLPSMGNRTADQPDDIQLAQPDEPSARQVGHDRRAGQLDSDLSLPDRGVTDLVGSVYQLGARVVNAADDVEALDDSMAATGVETAAAPGGGRGRGQRGAARSPRHSR